eukprot:2641402-Prorocentrum_lima.AAC.1
MTSSLVGSEMCIRDRSTTMYSKEVKVNQPRKRRTAWENCDHDLTPSKDCLLYTSDAADDM